MPTIRSENGFDLRIYTKDHNPPHVHVIKNGRSCRVKLGDEETAPMLWDVQKGMSLRDARQAEALVRKYQAECLEAWRKYYGET